MVLLDGRGRNVGSAERVVRTPGDRSQAPRRSRAACWLGSGMAPDPAPDRCGSSSSSLLGQEGLG